MHNLLNLEHRINVLSKAYDVDLVIVLNVYNRFEKRFHKDCKYYIKTFNGEDIYAHKFKALLYTSRYLRMYNEKLKNDFNKNSW